VADKKDDIVQTSIRFDADVYHGLKSKLNDIHRDSGKKLSMDAAVSAAVRAWLMGVTAAELANISATEASEGQTPHHQMLTEILASDDKAAIAVVAKNIEILHDRLKPLTTDRDQGGQPIAQQGSRRSGLKKVS